MSTEADLNGHLLAESVFSPYVCHFCKKFSEENKICQSCKLISYCCVDHQKEHWPYHKRVCRAVGKVIKKFHTDSIFEVAQDEKNWISRRSLAMCLIETVLKEQLTYSERQIFLFPAACFTCKSLKVNKTLTCKNCVNVGYCSPEHKTENEARHRLECEEFKLCFITSCAMVKKDYNLNLDMTLSKCVKYSSLLSQTMDDFINLFHINDSNENIANVICSETLTCIATLMYVIEKVNILSKVKDKVNITFVGSETAEGLENSLIKHSKMIQNWFPSLKDIYVTFIGPTNNMPDNSSLSDHKLNQSKVVFKFYSQLYHDFILSPDYSQPDLIGVFNCGFHDKNDSNNDPWLKTIPDLYRSKFATFFTSYNQAEAQKDYERFIDMKPLGKCIKVLNGSVRNPFRSLRPHRDWETDGIFYQNNYISIVEMQETRIMTSSEEELLFGSNDVGVEET